MLLRKISQMGPYVVGIDTVVSSRMARRYADPDQASHYALFGQRMRIAIILLLTPTICAKVLHYIWKL